MEMVAIKLMEMLAKKEGTYELNNLKTDMKFEIPNGNEYTPKMTMDVKVECESLKITVSNSKND